MSIFNKVFNFQTNGRGRMEPKERKTRFQHKKRRRDGKSNIEKWDKERTKEDTGNESKYTDSQAQC